MLFCCVQVQQAGCAAIASLPELRRLEISQCQSLTDTAACELMRLTALKELCLSNSSRVTDIALSTLVKAMPQLVLLDLSGCHLHVSDISLYAIAGLCKLQAKPAAFPTCTAPFTGHCLWPHSHGSLYTLTEMCGKVRMMLPENVLWAVLCAFEYLRKEASVCCSEA